jgi:hypothetical protein
VNGTSIHDDIIIAILIKNYRQHQRQQQQQQQHLPKRLITGR